jgi:hypothetical protein
MRPQVALLVGAVVVAPLCGGGCKGSSPGASTGDFVTDSIGPAGGQIIGPDGLTVLVPVGAVATTTSFTVGELEPSAAPSPPTGYAYAGPVFSLEPHGFAFAMPVTINVPEAAYGNTFHATCPAGTAHGTSTGCVWDPAPVFDVSGGSFTAGAFSLYAVVQYPDGGSPTGDVDGGCLPGSPDAGGAEGQLLPDCGNLTLTTTPSCELVNGTTCQSLCIPANLVSACATQLEVSCSGSCTAGVAAPCTAACQSACTGGCMEAPATFTCEIGCDGDCIGQCSSQCPSGADQAECAASCQQMCGAMCHGQCASVDPSAPCDTQCASACQGSCTAQANFSCGIACQEMGYASCQSTLQSACQSECSQPTGALFCNGQYVAVDGFAQVQACVGQIGATYSVTVSCGQ